MKRQQNLKNSLTNFCNYVLTLDSRIDVGQGINLGPGKFGKTNKLRATTTKLRNIHRNWKIFLNLINIGPLIRP